MSSSSSSSSGRKCRQMSLEEIKEATDDFNKSNVIGKGGEGKVYVAKIKLGPDSEITQVVVKRLKKASKQFDMEIKAMSKIDHPNLVCLLGYCDQPGKEMLVYEYLDNGTLANYLEKKSRVSMSWQVRVRICIDAARGLSHLHTGTDEYAKGIIHRDVKPDNILLDKNGVAKISDFGLLKLSKRAQENSVMGTNVKGTGGYFAPEYVTYRRVTRKIDVYAFGVILFQVLCLRSPWKEEEDETYFYTGDEDFGLLARENIDPTIKDEITDDSLEIFTNVIGQSMKKEPDERPTMESVVSSLVEVALSLKSKVVENEAKQGRASTTKVKVPGYSGPRFGLDELLRATDGFNDAKVIVRGEFAITYEGLLDDGRTVAVKRCDLDSFPSADEYLNEIFSLSKYQSDYIVSIIGICADEESDEMILVHEFMKNRTLAYHMLEKESTLSWNQRLRICIDAARGLEYLHHGISNTKRIIHRNVNPFSILLDEQWGAKLSDFGFQRMARANTLHSAVKTDVKGDMKYVDPHYNLTGILTRRSDVYSFGMVLFDVLFGMEFKEGGYMDRRNNVRQRTGKSLNNDSLDEIDERLKGQISLQCFKEIMKIASSCTNVNPANRPNMTEVVEKLESALQISQQTQPSI